MAHIWPVALGTLSSLAVLLGSERCWTNGPAIAETAEAAWVWTQTVSWPDWRLGSRWQSWWRWSRCSSTRGPSLHKVWGAASAGGVIETMFWHGVIVYCTSKAKDKYYEGRLELVLYRHSVEREVRAYTSARTERYMVVQLKLHK